MAGEIYEIDTSDDRASDISPENIPLTIIHEDRDIIVINKAAGMVMHPAPGNRKGTLLSAVLHHDRRSSLAHEMPALVHRLDKDTTGLLVVARTARAMADLTAQFAAHSAGRIYTAIARGDVRTIGIRSVRGMTITPSPGAFRIESMIGRDRSNPLRQSVRGRNGKRAITHIECLETLAGAGCSLVQCRLETGRTHQIRVHLAHLGHPLVGDQIYGAGATLLPQHLSPAMRFAVHDFSRQALHAGELSFDHPGSRERLTFQAALPDDMSALLATLRSGIK